MPRTKQADNKTQPHDGDVSAFLESVPHAGRREDAYAMLGIDKSASDGELKKTYRRLMSQHHPDKLVAKGLPDEMIKDATEKTQHIKKAYETIKLSRGL